MTHSTTKAVPGLSKKEEGYFFQCIVSHRSIQRIHVNLESQLQHVMLSTLSCQSFYVAKIMCILI